MSLVLEVPTAVGGWREIGRHDGGLPGSMSWHNGGKRDLLGFYFAGDHSIVRRSIGGLDTESADRSMRLTLPLGGWEELARLEDGETFELDLQTDRMPEAVPARFRHER